MATTKKKGSARSRKAKKVPAKDLAARGKVKGGFDPQPEPPQSKVRPGTVSRPFDPGFQGGVKVSV